MQELLLALWQQRRQTIVFVTHDVREAVILADRVLVLDQASGRVREEVAIALDRPRQTSAGLFQQYEARLHQLLRAQ